MYPFKARLNLLWDLFLSVQVIVCAACACLLTLFLSGSFVDNFQRTEHIGFTLGAFSILCFLLNLTVSTCFIINRIRFKGWQNKTLLLKSAQITCVISLVAIFVLFVLIASVSYGLDTLFLVALICSLAWFFCLFLIAVVFDKWIQPKGALKQSVIILLIAFYAWLAIDFVLVQQIVMRQFINISYGLIVLAMVFPLTLLVDFLIYKIQQLRQKPQKDHAIL